MKKKTFLFSFFLTISILSGCMTGNPTSSSGASGKEYEVIRSYVPNVVSLDNTITSPFGTVMTLVTYCQDDNSIIFPSFKNEILRLHKLFDRYYYYADENNEKINNLKVLNDSYGSGKILKVDKDMIELLKLSIELSELTEGYFNPTMGVLIDTWNYVEKDGQKYLRFSPYCLKEEDIDNSEVVEAMDNIVPYDKLNEVIVIDEVNNTVEFKRYNDVDNVVISLGAIAKGYAVEKCKKMVETYNVPLMIDGGSSSSYALYDNPHPDRDYWSIVISSPYKQFLEPIGLLKARFNGTYALSVSGDYENCFYFENEDGSKTIRHHLLNPYTGYPENYNRVISLKCDSRSDVLDGLSTALFSIESIEKVLDILKVVEDYFSLDIEVLLEREIDQINQKIDVYITKDYKDTLVSYTQKYFNEFKEITKK